MKRYENQKWKQSMRLRLDFNNMMSDMLGEEQGISKKSIDAMAGKLIEAAKAMETKRAEGRMQWRDLPYNQKETVADILETAAKIKDKFEVFVVLGIGGSALGPIAVQQALNHLHYNELSKEQRGGCPGSMWLTMWIRSGWRPCLMSLMWRSPYSMSLQNQAAPPRQWPNS